MITNINVSIQKDSSGHEPDISSGEVKRKAGRNLNNCTEFALQIIEKNSL